MNQPPVSWSGAIPRSTRFDDIYYNPEDPLGESRHVFIQGAELARQIGQHDWLCVGETGFGTGLNFLLSWQCWRQQRPGPGQWMRYCSIEAYPLSVNNIKKALQPFEELKELSGKLLEQYPATAAGFHLLSWPEERLELVLIFLPVEQTLQQLASHMHCWYLDGFAPAKNPEMWSDTVLQAIADHSLPGATLATFTAVGRVRRTLESCGFAMRKSPGFGRKRDMLTGIYQAKTSQTARYLPAMPNWLQQPAQASRRALVLGAGIAGAQVAWHLRQLGYTVTVAEGRESVASQGSGNPRGLISPALHADASRASRFFLQSYAYAWQQIRQLQQQGHAVQARQCGIHRLISRKEQVRFERALQRHGLDQPTATDESPLRITTARLPDESSSPSLYIQDSGWVDPKSWVTALLADCEVITGFQAVRLQQADGLWQLGSEDGRSLRAEVLVLCQSLHALQWPQGEWLPLRARPGHLLYWPANGLSEQLAQALTGQHYLLPAECGQLVAGSSFEHLPRDAWFDPLPLQAEALERLALDLRKDWPWLGEVPNPLQGRRAMRAVTPDHLPLAGPLPDRPGWEQWLAPHARGMALSRLRGHPPNLPGLFLLSGLGARGLAAAPLAARLVCDWIHNPQQLSAPLAVAEALHPGRFLLRQARQGETGKT